MRTAVFAIVAIWLVCMVSLASDPVGDYDNALGKATKLKARYQADLQRIVKFVNEASGGKSKLMVDKRAGADPRTGHGERPLGFEDTPQVSFFQVSTPVHTTIDSESCEILGAARFVSPVGPVPGRGGANAGVYMLVRPCAVHGRPSIALVSVSAGKDGKLEFKKRATVYTTESAKAMPPSLAVAFPAANASETNPACRFHVAMGWRGRSLEFAMDLETEFI